GHDADTHGHYAAFARTDQCPQPEFSLELPLGKPPGASRAAVTKKSRSLRQDFPEAVPRGVRECPRLPAALQISGDFPTHGPLRTAHQNSKPNTKANTKRQLPRRGGLGWSALQRAVYVPLSE